MREEFILNIYKNDEWASLWAVEDKAQRVLGIMEQRNETQRLGIGEGRYGETEIFAQGGGGVRIFRTREGGVRVSHTTRWCAKFSHRALFTRANAKLDSFKWP